MERSRSSAPRLGRVLVTGAAGFSGSHLAEVVLPHPPHVRALVRYNSRNHAGWLDASPQRDSIEVVAGDVRDYDSVSLAVKGCDTECTGTVTNIGMNTEVSVGELIQVISDLRNVSVEVETEDSRVRPDASEVYRLRCDNAKILSLTGWRPEYDLLSGLAKTVDWFREQDGHGEARSYVI
jgi:nucleoside-diphosphate-sugar epimerase